MVNATRNIQDFGIDGYYIPMKQSYLEKPHTFMISKGKNLDYLTSLAKEK